MDTRWEVEHFRLFFIFLVAGLVYLVWESLNFSISPNTEKEMKLYHKIASRLGKHLLRAKSKAENFGLLALYLSFIFICCLTAPLQTFGYYWGNSLTQLMLIIAFGLSIFVPKVVCRGWVSTPNWVPSGLWLQWHNPLTYSPQIAENTLPRLAPTFSKMWKCPKYPKQL